MNQAFNTAGVSEFYPQVMQLFSEDVIYIEPIYKWSKQ